MRWWKVGRAEPRCGTRSYGVGEFGEGYGDPMPRVDIDTEFVVAASEALDERVSGADYPCRA